MTGSNLLLDTSAVIELFKGNPLVASRLEKETTITVPSIVLGELYFGVYRSSNPVKHMQQVKQLLIIVKCFLSVQKLLKYTLL